MPSTKEINNTYFQLITLLFWKINENLFAPIFSIIKQ